MTYLSPRALQGLKQYQYKSGGYTLLDDIHQPFWNGEQLPMLGCHARSEYAVCSGRTCHYWLLCTGIVNVLPLWLAPNLITLIGIFALVVAYVTTLFYLPGIAGILLSTVLSTDTQCNVNRHTECKHNCRQCSTLGILFQWFLCFLVLASRLFRRQTSQADQEFLPARTTL